LKTPLAVVKSALGAKMDPKTPTLAVLREVASAKFQRTECFNEEKDPWNPKLDMEAEAPETLMINSVAVAGALRTTVLADARRVAEMVQTAVLEVVAKVSVP